MEATKEDNRGYVSLVPTFTAQIYIGRHNTYDDVIVPVSVLKKVCQDYCDSIGLCVSITELQFCYTDGNEPGIMVGFINYPRFPSENQEIINHARVLAIALKRAAKQKRCSIVFPDETVMLDYPEV